MPQTSDVNIIVGDPPNIEAVAAVFPLTGHEVFAWDGTIYNPGGGDLSPWLIEHEKVHFEQQRGDPKAWWQRYLVDPIWRLAQEMEAHQVEYKTYCRVNRDRNRRSFYLMQIAQRISSPMYGSMISQQAAMSRIRNGR